MSDWQPPRRPADLRVDAPVVELVRDSARHRSRGHTAGMSVEQQAERLAAALAEASAAVDRLAGARWSIVRDALTAGAAPAQVATAYGCRLDELLDGFRRYADVEHDAGRLSAHMRFELDRLADAATRHHDYPHHPGDLRGCPPCESLLWRRENADVVDDGPYDDDRVRLSLTVSTRCEVVVGDRAGECARLLRDTADRVEAGERAAMLRDGNGNLVGSWAIGGGVR